MKKLLTLFATIALTAVCVTPTPLYAADVQTEKTNETVSNAVAEINGTSYASLSEAIQSVQEGQSIKLLQDINLTASISFQNQEPYHQSITLSWNNQGTIRENDLNLDQAQIEKINEKFNIDILELLRNINQN